MVFALDPLGPAAPRGACADPVFWPLVDVAFDRPGSTAGRVMTKALCTGCPTGEVCLAHAMSHREHGIWGGTSLYSRTLAGAPGSPMVETARRRALIDDSSTPTPTTQEKP